jgi:hypothetical protein
MSHVEIPVVPAAEARGVMAFPAIGIRAQALRFRRLILPRITTSDCLPSISDPENSAGKL